MKNINYRTLCTATILSALVLLSSGCACFAPNIPILTSKDKIYVVPENTKLEVIWDKKKVVITTDEDMLLMYKGTFYESIKDKDEDTIR